MVILCNEGIEHINAYKTTIVEEQEEPESYKAELKAVRAMFYFYLMDLYGRVPLVTQTGVKSNEMTLADRKTLFFWIYNELNEAMPYLSDEKSNRPNTEYYGRVTATVAYFLMMKPGHQRRSIYRQRLDRPDSDPTAARSYSRPTTSATERSSRPTPGRP